MQDLLSIYALVRRLATSWIIAKLFRQLFKLLTNSNKEKSQYNDVRQTSPMPKKQTKEERYSPKPWPARPSRIAIPKRTTHSPSLMLNQQQPARPVKRKTTRTPWRQALISAAILERKY